MFTEFDDLVQSFNQLSEGVKMILDRAIAFLIFLLTY